MESKQVEFEFILEMMPCWKIKTRVRIALAASTTDLFWRQGQQINNDNINNNNNSSSSNEQFLYLQLTRLPRGRTKKGFPTKNECLAKLPFTSKERSLEGTESVV